MGQAARRSDVVFVLAGEPQRKIHGLELYRAGYAPRILLSVGRFEIRRFAELDLPYPPGSAPIDLLAARPISPRGRHFFVTFSADEVSFEKIAPGWLGTLREIRALAKWCKQRPEITSLIMVSSGYHLRRVRLCCRALLPKAIRVTYAAVPGEAEVPAREFALELLKLPFYGAVLAGVRLARAFARG
ncbi:MAG TPA: hypothetical protein VOA78_06195 [Candidatus Dormibacteraeota bacterium]|nr:hypothetical protein [Candidatus Dormibacteraeota bacterium]